MTRLTVVVYGVGEDVVSGPIPLTPLLALFQQRGYEPGIFAQCAQQCLAQIADRPAVVVAPSYGLAVVGTSLVLGGEIVGAAVAGYAFVDFCRPSAVERLARAAGAPFSQVWAVARVTPPVPERRLILHGQLLQVLGDTILRENYRTRQYEETAEQLTAAAAVKNDFLAMVSHELRTPLAPILLWSQMLRRTRDPERVERALNVIEGNARLQARMVEDLVELTRTTRGTISLDLQAHELGREIRAAVDSVFELATERNIELQYVEAEALLDAEVDRDRLQQILRNVLSNALKFTPAGGRIVVTVGREVDTGIVRIQDTGAGITPEFLPFVFDMFRQQEATTGSKAGLGIGLALVRQLVELHGGNVTITSAGVGQGTEVTIRLPLIRERRHGLRLSPNPEGRLRGHHILVIEDRDDVVEAVEAMLAHLGARVSVARAGAAALEMVQSHPPTVVLCDLQMPGMSGFEFIRTLHAVHGHHPPVIAMTGLGSGSDRRETQAAGFQGHLDKPFGEAELLHAIEAAVGAGPHD